MRRSAWLCALSATIATLLASCGQKPDAAATGDWRSGIKEVRMAVSGSNDDPMIVRRRGVYQAHLAKALGLPVKLYESSDYNGVIQALSSGQVDLAQMAGGSYANVDAQVGELVAPILSLRQAEGGTGYYSSIVVRADSPYRSVADLKGRSLAYVDFNSTSGYLVPRAKLREQGIDPDTYFGKTGFAGGHTQAVMSLANGQFDAAILQASGGDPEHGFSRGALHTMARRGLVEVEDFRIIWTAGPIPSEAFVVRTDRPQPMIDLVRGAMGALPYDEPDLWPELGQLDGSAYTSVNRDHYKDIIALRAADLAQRRGQGGRP
ncbi:phosphate/phosphite/phosphonate ABC transporter substrate-binding protein [Phenylobacterium sp.]|uniref:phosphate/phosphite/phosphonate ABC transporter substrate-binding protein n=1 Tax=Phenylobacterium sp. TaxID=1871053 RepID=UPI00286C81D6|nr:phosphate/phosphite/phosphonate ABC transporter substrate-binding protein [Phenylobacterium sp.]